VQSYCASFENLWTWGVIFRYFSYWRSLNQFECVERILDDLWLTHHFTTQKMPHSFGVVPENNRREKRSVVPGDSERVWICTGSLWLVLRGGYLYGAWPRTVLILIEFKFIVSESWQLVVFCTCWILPEGLKFVHNFSLRGVRKKKESEDEADMLLGLPFKPWHNPWVVSP